MQFNLPGVALSRGALDAVARLTFDSDAAIELESGVAALSVDGLPLIAVGGRRSAALKLEESGEDPLAVAPSHAARSAFGFGGSPR